MALPTINSASKSSGSGSGGSGSSGGFDINKFFEPQPFFPSKWEPVKKPAISTPKFDLESFMKSTPTFWFEQPTFKTTPINTTISANTKAITDAANNLFTQLKITAVKIPDISLNITKTLTMTDSTKDALKAAANGASELNKLLKTTELPLSTFQKIAETGLNNLISTSQQIITPATPKQQIELVTREALSGIELVKGNSIKSFDATNYTISKLQEIINEQKKQLANVTFSKVQETLLKQSGFNSKEILDKKNTLDAELVFRPQDLQKIPTFTSKLIESGKIETEALRNGVSARTIMGDYIEFKANNPNSQDITPTLWSNFLPTDTSIEAIANWQEGEFEAGRAISWLNPDKYRDKYPELYKTVPHQTSPQVYYLNELGDAKVSHLRKEGLIGDEELKQGYISTIKTSIDPTTGKQQSAFQSLIKYASLTKDTSTSMPKQLDLRLAKEYVLKPTTTQKSMMPTTEIKNMMPEPSRQVEKQEYKTLVFPEKTTQDLIKFDYVSRLGEPKSVMVTPAEYNAIKWGLQAIDYHKRGVEGYSAYVLQDQSQDQFAKGGVGSSFVTIKGVGGMQLPTEKSGLIVGNILQDAKNVSYAVRGLSSDWSGKTIIDRERFLSEEDQPAPGPIVDGRKGEKLVATSEGLQVVKPAVNAPILELHKASANPLINKLLSMTGSDYVIEGDTIKGTSLSQLKNSGDIINAIKQNKQKLGTDQILPTTIVVTKQDTSGWVSNLPSWLTGNEYAKNVIEALERSYKNNDQEFEQKGLVKREETRIAPGVTVPSYMDIYGGNTLPVGTTMDLGRNLYDAKGFAANLGAIKALWDGDEDALLTSITTPEIKFTDKGLKIRQEAVNELKTNTRITPKYGLNEPQLNEIVFGRGLLTKDEVKSMNPVAVVRSFNDLYGGNVRALLTQEEQKSLLYNPDVTKALQNHTLHEGQDWVKAEMVLNELMSTQITGIPILDIPFAIGTGGIFGFETGIAKNLAKAGFKVALPATSEALSAARMLATEYKALQAPTGLINVAPTGFLPKLGSITVVPGDTGVIATMAAKESKNGVNIGDNAIYQLTTKGETKPWNPQSISKFETKFGRIITDQKKTDAFVQQLDTSDVISGGPSTELLLRNPQGINMEQSAKFVQDIVKDKTSGSSYGTNALTELIIKNNRGVVDAAFKTGMANIKVIEPRIAADVERTLQSTADLILRDANERAIEVSTKFAKSAVDAAKLDSVKLGNILYEASKTAGTLPTQRMINIAIEQGPEYSDVLIRGLVEMENAEALLKAQVPLPKPITTAGEVSIRGDNNIYDTLKSSAPNEIALKDYKAMELLYSLEDIRDARNLIEQERIAKRTGVALDRIKVYQKQAESYLNKFKPKTQVGWIPGGVDAERIVDLVPESKIHWRVVDADMTGIKATGINTMYDMASLTTKDINKISMATGISPERIKVYKEMAAESIIWKREEATQLMTDEATALVRKETPLEEATKFREEVKNLAAYKSWNRQEELTLRSLGIEIDPMSGLAKITDPSKISSMDNRLFNKILKEDEDTIRIALSAPTGKENEVIWAIMRADIPKDRKFALLDIRSKQMVDTQTGEILTNAKISELEKTKAAEEARYAELQKEYISKSSKNERPLYEGIEVTERELRESRQTIMDLQKQIENERNTLIETAQQRVRTAESTEAFDRKATLDAKLAKDVEQRELTRTSEIESTIKRAEEADIRAKASIAELERRRKITRTKTPKEAGTGAAEKLKRGDYQGAADDLISTKNYDAGSLMPNSKIYDDLTIEQILKMTDHGAPDNLVRRMAWEASEKAINDLKLLGKEGKIAASKITMAEKLTPDEIKTIWTNSKTRELYRKAIYTEVDGTAKVLDDVKAVIDNMLPGKQKDEMIKATKEVKDNCFNQGTCATNAAAAGIKTVLAVAGMAAIAGTAAISTTLQTASGTPWIYNDADKKWYEATKVAEQKQYVPGPLGTKMEVAPAKLAFGGIPDSVANAYKILSDSKIVDFGKSYTFGNIPGIQGTKQDPIEKVCSQYAIMGVNEINKKGGKAVGIAAKIRITETGKPAAHAMIGILGEKEDLYVVNPGLNTDDPKSYVPINNTAIKLKEMTLVDPISGKVFITSSDIVGTKGYANDGAEYVIESATIVYDPIEKDGILISASDQYSASAPPGDKNVSSIDYWGVTGNATVEPRKDVV